MYCLSLTLLHRSRCARNADHVCHGETKSFCHETPSHFIHRRVFSVEEMSEFPHTVPNKCLQYHPFVEGTCHMMRIARLGCIAVLLLFSGCASAHGHASPMSSHATPSVPPSQTVTSTEVSCLSPYPNDAHISTPTASRIFALSATRPTRVFTVSPREAWAIGFSEVSGEHLHLTDLGRQCSCIIVMDSGEQSPVLSITSCLVCLWFQRPMDGLLDGAARSSTMTGRGGR